jgi:hypothetical protein
LTNREVAVRVAKLSLINLLMEDGEEDLAVLIAHSDLPDELEIERDSARLAELGLTRHELHALLPGITGDAAAEPRIAADEMAQLEQTISDRWADLVSHWVRG